MSPEATLAGWDRLQSKEVAPGIHRRSFNSDRLTLARFTIARGAVVPVHKHEQEQISSVISGALRFQVGGREVLVRAGELLQIPSWVEHGVDAVEDSEVIDTFSSIRQDWLDGTDNYFKNPR
jgi:quercetin dioxygenase-like cupin family protein